MGRWPPNPSEARSFETSAVRFPARPPNAGCSSAVRTPPLLSGFYSGHLLGRQRRAAGSPGRIPWAREDQPTRPHPGQSPLGALQNPPSGRTDEGVPLSLGANPLADAIHRLGDFVWSMARNVLHESGAVYLASGSTGAAGEPLDLVEYLIRNRDSGFHTGSITAGGRHRFHAFAPVARRSAVPLTPRVSAGGAGSARRVRAGPSREVGGPGSRCPAARNFTEPVSRQISHSSSEPSPEEDQR